MSPARPTKALLALIAALVALIGWELSPPLEGQHLVEVARRATYRERGLRMPPDRIAPDSHVHRLHPWHSHGTAGPNVLVIGASVAAGASASDQDHTWWALLADRLPARVLNVASDGAMTGDEIGQLRTALEDGPQFAAIVALHGANDFWTDYPTPAEKTRANVEAVQALADRSGARLVLCWQPTLADKRPWSSIEMRLMRYWPRVEEYQRFTADAWTPGTVDLRHVWDGKKTTTEDLWHPTDPGAELLERAIERTIRGIA